MMRAYSDPSREGEKWALPDVEIFHLGEHPRALAIREEFGAEGEPLPSGWYWWTCIPGCMPDSEPFGPFPSAEAAKEAAQRTD